MALAHMPGRDPAALLAFRPRSSRAACGWAAALILPGAWLLAHLPGRSGWAGLRLGCGASAVAWRVLLALPA